MLESSRVRIQLNFHRIRRALILIFVINIVFLVGTGLQHSGALANAPSSVRRLVGQFNLGTENVAASWYSSMLLFLVGLTAGFCYLADNQRLSTVKERVLNLGWVVFVGIFLTLSFDEMGSIHEMIGDSPVFQSLGKGVSGGGWYIFYVLIAAVGLFMMLFFFAKFFRNGASLILAIVGVLLFLSNPFQENFEIGAMRNSPNPETWQRPTIFLLLEEGSELFASYCLLLSFTLYLKSSVLKKASQQAPIPKLTLPSRSSLNVQYVLVILSVAALMVSVELFLPVPQYQGSGIAVNWFPSALCFFCFLVALYASSTSKLKAVYRSVACASLGMSILYGANLYEPTDLVYKFVKTLVLAGVLAAAIFMAWKFSSQSGKLLAILAAITTILAFIAAAGLLPFLGYFIFALITFSVAGNLLEQRQTGF